MAYAAVVSLMQVLEQLLGPDQVLIRCPKSQIKFLSDKVASLKAFLNNESPEYKWSKTKNSLEKEIRDAMWRAEDIVESSLSGYFLSSGSENPGDESGTPMHSEDLEKVIQEVESITKKTMKFTEDVTRGRILPEITSTTPICKNKIVGFDKNLEDLKHQLIEEKNITALGALPIIGMSGIGKTTLATCFYNDPLTVEHFETRVWAAASQVFRKRDILLNLLASMKVLDDEMRKKTDDQLQEHITSNLKGKRYLVVLDNVSDAITWMDFITLLPFENKSSKILVTTTIQNVAERVIQDTQVNFKNHKIHKIGFLDEFDSWNLFRETVFADEPCPQELQKFGKKIAKNCQGLPLAIITAGGHLAKAEKSPEYWKNVAESGNSLIADTDEAAVMIKQLSSGYKLLPQHLKACFLSLAVFSQNYEVPASKLIKFWVSEGFREPMKANTLEAVAEHYLKELVGRNLILVIKRSSIGGIKTCTVHSAMWMVCSKKAKKSKFLYIIKKHADCSFPEGTNNSPRRLSIINNIVFGIKDAYNSMDSLSTVRSLLCVGPHHPYPLRVCLGFKLLRVLDTLTIRFCKFPAEILVLFMLRYLALTYSGGELPTGVSKLRNLQFLIVRLHHSLKFSAAPSYLPMEIWSMKELRHLQVMGSDLPDPQGAKLPNLHTLLDVSAYSCTLEVFNGINRLKKLGIRIVLTHEDAGEPLHPFDHLSTLYLLFSLKCVVVNPTFESQVITLPNSHSFFPNYLRKLTLSGCGFPWEDMRKIAQLQSVKVLKLRCHAFRGPTWTTQNEWLESLEFLLLEDLDLEHWRADGEAFKDLKHLCIKQCYNVEVLPSRFAWTNNLALIELVDCKPSTVGSAKKLEDTRLGVLGKYRPLKVTGHFSWEDDKPIRPSQEF